MPQKIRLDKLIEKLTNESRNEIHLLFSKLQYKNTWKNYKITYTNTFLACGYKYFQIFKVNYQKLKKNTLKLANYVPFSKFQEFCQ